MSRSRRRLSIVFQANLSNANASPDDWSNEDFFVYPLSQKKSATHVAAKNRNTFATVQLEIVVCWCGV